MHGQGDGPGSGWWTEGDSVDPAVVELQVLQQQGPVLGEEVSTATVRVGETFCKATTGSPPGTQGAVQQSAGDEHVRGAMEPPGY